MSVKPKSPLPWRMDDDGEAIVDANGACVAMWATDCGDEMDPQDQAAIILAVNERWNP